MMHHALTHYTHCGLLQQQGVSPAAIPIITGLEGVCRLRRHEVLGGVGGGAGGLDVFYTSNDNTWGGIASSTQATTGKRL